MLMQQLAKDLHLAALNRLQATQAKLLDVVEVLEHRRIGLLSALLLILENRRCVA